MSSAQHLRAAAASSTAVLRRSAVTSTDRPRILLAALCNPPKSFQDTRHNIGAVVIGALADELQLTWHANRALRGDVAECEERNLVLFRPTKSYMNVIGKSIKRAVTYANVDASNLMVLHDDLERPVGRVSFKKSGSANGHNGVKSVIASLGSDQFARCRIGIGRPSNRDNVAEYVLERFGPRDSSIIKSHVIPATVAALASVIDISSCRDAPALDRGSGVVAAGSASEDAAMKPYSSPASFHSIVQQCAPIRIDVADHKKLAA